MRILNVSWRIHHDVLYINKQMLIFHESKVHQKAELWIIRNLIFFVWKGKLRKKGAVLQWNVIWKQTFSKVTILQRSQFFNTIVISNKKCLRVEYCKMLIWHNIQKHLYRMEHESNRGRMSNAVYMRKYRDTPVYYGT